MGSRARRRARGLAAAAALLALPLLAGTAGAQEADLDEPPMADAPTQFRLSLSGGWISWAEPDDGGQRIDDAPLFGVDLETAVSRYLAFRFGAAYGQTTITGTAGPGGEQRTVDANQVVLDLVAVPRLPVGALRRAGVVPFGVVGLGSVVHDPSAPAGAFDPALPSRSQGSVVFGGGLELQPAAVESFGLRLEWRRADVQVQNAFAVTDREGTGRSADRFMGTLYWSF